MKIVCGDCGIFLPADHGLYLGYFPARTCQAQVIARKKISAERNKCFAEQLATVSDHTPLGKLIAGVTLSFSKNGKRIRGLDITGKTHGFRLGQRGYREETVIQAKAEYIITAFTWIVEETTEAT